MKQKYLEPIIDYLQKRIGKIISDNDLQYLQKEILGHDYDIKKFYKLIFQLKQKQHLIPLKKDLYLISYPENKQLNINQIVEDYYRPFLHKLISTHCKKRYYIWGIKWLELFLNNKDYNEGIDVYTDSKSGSDTIISHYEISFKSYKSNKSLDKKAHPCFALGLEFKNTIEISWKEFFVWPLELCVLESLYYNNSNSSTYLKELIKKTIKKHSQRRNREIIKKVILAWKHHTSLNRLYDLSLGLDKDFTHQCNLIIKQLWFKISL